MGAKDKWNARNYDCISIRFPKGTKRRFKSLFPGVPFNSYIVNLLISRLVIAEMDKSAADDKKELM